MTTLHDSAGELIGVSCPGGMARQFRVQVRSTDTPSQWKMIGSFRDRTQAGECAALHAKAGEKTRVVVQSTLPTAA